MKNLKISIYLAILIVLCSCKDTGLPPDPFIQVEFRMIHHSNTRTDTIQFSDYTHFPYYYFRYSGIIKKNGYIIKQIDTLTYMDMNNSDYGTKYSFFENIIFPELDSILQNYQGQLDTSKDYFTIDKTISNGTKYHLTYSEIIPKIDSLRVRFKRIYEKLLPEE